MRKAEARLQGDAEHPCLKGRITFTACGAGTLVEAEIRGLPESETGFFAFHIHEGGGCGGAGFADTGAHYNPDNLPHPLHRGDLPPLLSVGGRARMTVLTGRFTPEEVVGRTVVIHSHPDDFHTQPSGGAGTKIACGVIRACGIYC